MELALIVITSYYFFAISEGGFFEFKWSFEDFANAFFTLWMVTSNWFIFKKLNTFLYERNLSSPLSKIIHGIISVVVLGLYTSVFNWLYIEIIWREALGDTLFLNLVLPLALLTFSVWNVGFFFFQKHEKGYLPFVSGKQNSKTERKQQLISKIGKKNYIIPIDNVAFLATDGGYVYACTFDHKSFLLDGYLNSLEKQMDEGAFFRVNRQMIISRTAIIDYQLEINQKIKVRFFKVDGFQDTAMVSRYRSPHFKTWLKY